MAIAAPVAELIAENDKRDRKGRRITPRERRVELVEAYRTSGMTMAQFARREGINRFTLAKWATQLGRPRPMPFAELKLAMPTAAIWSYEMTLPNGLTVRAASAPALVQLIDLIRP